MTEASKPEADKPAEENDATEAAEAPLNRAERRAAARGKSGGKGKQSIGEKKSQRRSQQPKGPVGKFMLPTKNG
jgi:hypothetical protein